jgi:hypothetical protein
MIRVVFAFVVLFVLFFMGIKFAQSMSGKQALELTKIAGYSIICTVLAIAVIVGISTLNF